jgi:hypothetical protein
MIKTPPFERGRNHRNDRPELVERLWGMINSKFWYDSRLRSVAGRPHHSWLNEPIENDYRSDNTSVEVTKIAPSLCFLGRLWWVDAG